MVAYLEKTDRNAEFHEIIDFLTRSLIQYAITVIAGKPVLISEASIRSDLQFNDAAGIDVLPNQRMKVQFQKDHLKPNPYLLLLTQVKTSLSHSLTRSSDLLLLTQFLIPFQKVLMGIMEIKQLKKKAKPVISHHNAWIKNVSMKKRLARKKSLKTKLMQKESVSKQGRKPAKSEPTVHKDPAFDDLDDAMDYMETEDAYDEGTPNKGTAEPNEGTAEPKDRNSDESVAPTTVFRDDETIAQFLMTMSQNKTKQKRVDIKEIKDTDRTRTTTERSILTLKPLPKSDPKDKGKKVLEEKVELDAESEGVNEAEKKFKMLANDKEIAKKV
ncbi:hypothetical protein Tco_1452893, partial [Tanacetum coccineum]